MKIKILISIMLLSFLISCSAEKESQQKQNFMMPGKADLPRNEKYKPAKSKKTYKTKTKKKKKKAYACNFLESYIEQHLAFA